MYKFVIAVVAAVTFAVPAHADIAGAPSPVPGPKMCANHSINPKPGKKEIYKTACGVGTWGAPAPAAKK